MKKSLLALTAACVALSGMAGTQQKLQASAGLQMVNRSEVKGLPNLRLTDASASMFKAPAKVGSADDVITSVEGDVQEMTISGSGYYLFWGIMLAVFENEQGATHIVYGDNDEVYFYNIVPNFPVNSYIKGVKDGDKINIELPQTVLWDEAAGDGYNLALYDLIPSMDENGEPVLNDNGDQMYEYVPAEETTLTVAVAEDGSMELEGLSEEKMLAGGLCSDGAWCGYGAWDIKLVPFNDKKVEVPSDIEVSKNFWAYKQESLGYGYFLNFAQAYDEVYLQGMSEDMPDAWFKANVEYDFDNGLATLSIPQDQYLGAYMGTYYIYTKAAKLTEDEEGEPLYELMPEDYEYQMVWDLETNVITPKDPEVNFLYNAAKDRVYYLNEFYEFELVHQDSFEGTPADPYGLSFADYFESWGEGDLAFFVPAVSTEGDILDTDSLYYVIYVDGEEWTFDAEEYGLEESMVEIPWAFDSASIMNWGGTDRQIAFFVEGMSTIGVQSVYKYGDEETRSEIVTLELDPDAVAAVNADKKVASVKYFDVAGREVAKPAAGLVIKRVVYEDGTVASFKKMVR